MQIYLQKCAQIVIFPLNTCTYHLFFVPLQPFLDNPVIMNTNDGKILTLDELYDIFESPHYDNIRHEMGDYLIIPRNADSFEEYKVEPYLKSSSLLCNHLIAERLLTMNLDGLNLCNMGLLKPVARLKLAYLWMHPLAWTTSYEGDQSGAITIAAKERFDISRKQTFISQFMRIHHIGMKHFLDEELPLKVDEYFMPGSKTHNWEFITANVRDKALDNYWHKSTMDEAIRFINYDAKALRHSLSYIRRYRDDATAALVLRTLQKEWQTIKLWKIGTDSLTQDQILRFEQILMHGFDADLDEWEKQPVTTRPAHVPFKYLTAKAKDEKREHQVEKEIYEAWLKSDTELWDCFIRLYKHGFIENMLNYSTPKILAALEASFGPSKRTPRNFNNARNKVKID